jgi:hypothetical protein
VGVQVGCHVDASGKCPAHWLLGPWACGPLVIDLLVEISGAKGNTVTFRCKWTMQVGCPVDASGKWVRPMITGPHERMAHPSWTSRLKRPVQKKTLYSSVKKNNRESTAKMLPWRRSDGPERLIAVEASCIGTNYTFRFQNNFKFKFCSKSNYKHRKIYDHLEYQFSVIY